MNHEILFRGKSKNTGEWLYGDWLNYADTAQIWYTTEEGKWNSLVIPETRGQYTGLTDKNGKKIFEGDILKSDKAKLGRVTWMPEYCAFMIYVKSENRYCYLWDNDFLKIKVIGNIHDNPELLKEDNNA